MRNLFNDTFEFRRVRRDDTTARKEKGKELIFIFTQPYALLLTAKRQTIDVDNPLRVVVRAFCTLKSWLTVEIAEN